MHSGNQNGTMSIPPTHIESSDCFGTLKIWKGAIENEFNAEELFQVIPFRRNVVHGHFDRYIWEQKKVKEEIPSVLQDIGGRIETITGSCLDGCWNYANYYETGLSHCFTHRDYNCNPGEWITLVCFGSERRLVFARASIDATTSDQSPYYTILPLSDGSIVQFDNRFNTTHYHKILKEPQIHNTAAARISLQWFHPRDDAKWSEQDTELWNAHGTDKKHVKALKRRIKKDLEE